MSHVRGGGEKPSSLSIGASDAAATRGEGCFGEKEDRLEAGRDEEAPGGIIPVNAEQPRTHQDRQGIRPINIRL